METQVRTPQKIFNQPQRLMVPLFQRPYVWNEENQWAPMWADITRVADRVVAQPSSRHQPHFLGAVVLQQVQNQMGAMQEWIVIDGQQRLTTLQLLLDALHAELESVGAQQSALRVEALVANTPAFCEQPEDRFKVWPTNRDRDAFNEVMAAPSPVAYASLVQKGQRLVEAHRYFAEQIRSWLQLNGPDDVSRRAQALELTARELLQLVVIDLAADENAQEIFETLNARGAQLTAADLIKNFVFQRLMEVGTDVERVYEANWKDFETGFWEAEVGFGRLRHSRSSLFLNHWLISRTGEETVAREVFARFKRFADLEANVPMENLVEEITKASVAYRFFVEAASNRSGEVDRLGLFSYRSSVLESEVFKPVVLHLLDPSLAAVDHTQLVKAISVLESWLVRRMVVRATTKGYNRLAADLVTYLQKSDRSLAGDALEAFFRDQRNDSAYWPDDDEVRRELQGLQAYRRIRQNRLRMLLEAIEDERRGWFETAEGFGGQRVLRGKYEIEHVMPVRWRSHWPLGSVGEPEREQLVHTLGNLTLLTGRLNKHVSNAAWPEKSAGLRKHDVLKLNMELLGQAGDTWDEGRIRARTDAMVGAILRIWPVPVGHRSNLVSAVERPKRRVELIDIISAGLLEPGTQLFARRPGFDGRQIFVLPDGGIEVDGVAFRSPSGAAVHLVGSAINGWWFFLTDRHSKRALNDLWHEYVEMAAADADDSEVDAGELPFE